jgi:hypothetical protein
MGMTMASDEDTSPTLLERLQEDPAGAAARDDLVRRYRPRI